MSRIEEALEKAALLRKEQADPISSPARTGAGTSELYKRQSSATRQQVSTTPNPYPRVEPIALKNELLVSATDPQSPMAEEYRKLKEMVIKLTKQDHTQNTLMVTSAMAMEGKTTTALNLAISMAQEYDHTVLLVDADLRKPSIERYLGLGPTPGLTECLLDNTEIPDVLLRTGIGKLMILPAGRIAPNPGELFSSQKMRDLITEIKSRYPDRYIIIDTPPVLPFAETRTMSRIVDGVVMVVKAGLSSMENIKDAMDAMQGANILGLVYNQATIDTLTSSYAHYYKDYYSSYGNMSRTGT